MNVRKASLEDVDVLVSFQQQLASETENITLHPQILRKGIESLIKDPSKGYYTVAENNSEIVGCYMITYEWSDWRNGVVLWIQSVYIRKDQRKQGIFKKMYESLRTEVSHDPTVAGIRLYVDKTNVRAKEVYASLGMNGDHYHVFEWMK